jgi:hypothetical protein
VSRNNSVLTRAIYVFYYNNQDSLFFCAMFERKNLTIFVRHISNMLFMWLPTNSSFKMPGYWISQTDKLYVRYSYILSCQTWMLLVWDMDSTRPPANGNSTFESRSGHGYFIVGCPVVSRDFSKAHSHTRTPTACQEDSLSQKFESVPATGTNPARIPLAYFLPPKSLRRLPSFFVFIFYAYSKIRHFDKESSKHSI